jgi:predicted HAD superfamily Cof-like phosphohydrolase
MSETKNVTNFQKVQDFNSAFGVTRHSTHQKDIFTKDPKTVKLRYDLIAEEVLELKEAIDTHDFVEVRDALADILYVVYGAADAFGIDVDKDFDIVHQSNMSKLCNSEQEAIDTVKDYQDKYDAGNSPYDSPYFEYDDTIQKWIVKNKSTGKVLKNINYQKVDFSKE